MLLKMKGIFINISYKFLTNCKTQKKKKFFYKIMKIATRIISVIAILIIIFNMTLIDFSNFLSDNNAVALVTIIAGLCCLVIIRILVLTNKIKDFRKD